VKEYSLSKSEKLKSRTILTDLFGQGKSVFIYPIKLVYLVIPTFDDTIKAAQPPALFSVSVPKKKYKKAVARNEIKRKIRESYRLCKPNLYENLTQKDIKLALMYIYVGQSADDTNLLDNCLKGLHKKLLAQFNP
jgi:ribonuclease P protein component